MYALYIVDSINHWDILGILSDFIQKNFLVFFKIQQLAEKFSFRPNCLIETCSWPSYIIWSNFVSLAWGQLSLGKVLGFVIYDTLKTIIEIIWPQHNSMIKWSFSSLSSLFNILVHLIGFKEKISDSSRFSWKILIKY